MGFSVSGWGGWVFVPDTLAIAVMMVMMTRMLLIGDDEDDDEEEEDEEEEDDDDRVCHDDACTDGRQR